MKTRLLSFISLLVLLLVSTAILADGRPTGLRIGRLVSGGNMNVDLDVTVTGTNRYYESFSTSIELGPTVNNVFSNVDAWRFESSSRNVYFPYAVDWGDGESFRRATLLGPSTGPWTMTFSHTYSTPGTYVVTVGDALCCQTSGSAVINTGNPITSQTQYVWDSSIGNQTFSGNYGTVAAVTANATVSTGTGIPALNIYGLLAMALVLVGAGLLVFRRPQRAAF